MSELTVAVLWKSLAILALLAISGSAEAQAAAWHHSDASRSFSADSAACVVVARKVAGELRGQLYAREYQLCLRNEGWFEAVRYLGRDSCAAVKASFVDTPNDAATSTRDSLRGAFEKAIVADFFPRNEVKDMEARIAFGHAAGELEDTRIVSLKSSHRIIDLDSAAVQVPVMYAMTILQETASSGVVVLRAQCLRDLAKDSRNLLFVRSR